MGFEVGDFVVCKEDLMIGVDYNKNVKGFFGEVIYADTRRFTVEFYKYMNGHAGSSYGAGKEGHCWVVSGCFIDKFVKIKTNKR